MNNDLKYALQGFLLSLLLFFSVKVISFFSSLGNDINQDKQQLNIVIDGQNSKTIKNINGKTLFAQNCASCHAINKILTGPALAGVEERVPDKKILYEWIRNNQKVLQSGNAYFNTLYKAYNKIPMNLFPDLSDEDIDSILDYIKETDASSNSFLPTALINIKAE